MMNAELVFDALCTGRMPVLRGESYGGGGAAEAGGEGKAALDGAMEGVRVDLEVVGGEWMGRADVGGDDVVLVGEAVEDDGDEAGGAEAVAEGGFVGVKAGG